MHIAVFGTGGVGGYFGGRLAQAGEKVSFIARGQHLKAIRERGLRVESIAGDFTVHPASVSDDPVEIDTVDVVLLAVKSWQVAEAAHAMRPMIGPHTFVVPLLNGVEAPAQLAEILSPRHVLGGLCGIFSFLVGPGHVRHAGIAPFIKFGELDRRISDRTRELEQAFTRTVGLTVEVPADIHVAMWQKFLLICPWSGVGAVTRAPMGVIRSQPGTRRMLEAVTEEIHTLARARDIALAAEATHQAMTFYDNLPAEGTASMQRDILDGRPSELEAQNGAVVRLAEEVGIGVPVNALIYHSLLPMELRARGELQF
jgi:2-dehydropantoate 2-reductase